MNRLKELRNKHGLTQVEFAKRINSAQSTVANWESGARDIDTDTLHKLADFFGVTTDYILRRTDDPNPSPTRNDLADEDIKFALFGGRANMTDAQFEEVKRYARYIAERGEDDE